MNYYNKKYFDWQKKAGLYGAQQDLWMYVSLIGKSDRILDFGCGGGYMLEKINCRQKYGVDINPQAREEAMSRGIKVYEKTTDIPESVKFDVIYLHHALEHTENPRAELIDLKKYLKIGGSIICVVPIDDWRSEKKFDKKDINKHLYTWTPQLLGNLFATCGYKVNRVEIIERCWLPLSRLYYDITPKILYNFLSLIWSRLTLSRQIRIIAKR